MGIDFESVSGSSRARLVVVLVVVAGGSMVVMLLGYESYDLPTVCPYIGNVGWLYYTKCVIDPKSCLNPQIPRVIPFHRDISPDFPPGYSPGYFP